MEENLSGRSEGLKFLVQCEGRAEIAGFDVDVFLHIFLL